MESLLLEPVSPALRAARSRSLSLSRSRPDRSLELDDILLSAVPDAPEAPRETSTRIDLERLDATSNELGWGARELVEDVAPGVGLEGTLTKVDDDWEGRSCAPDTLDRTWMTVEESCMESEEGPEETRSDRDGIGNAEGGSGLVGTADTDVGAEKLSPVDDAPSTAAAAAIGDGLPASVERASSDRGTLLSEMKEPGMACRAESRAS